MKLDGDDAAGVPAGALLGGHPRARSNAPALLHTLWRRAPQVHRLQVSPFIYLLHWFHAERNMLP